MKIFLLSLFITAFAITANAQSETFKPFRVDLTPGLALFSGSGSSTGFLIAIEPKYALTDNISVGLRYEGAIAASSTSIDFSNENAEFSGGSNIKFRSSYLLTGDYYFNTNSFRPFFGAGAGMFGVASANFDMMSENFESSTASAGYKFGFAPRIGAEFNHFRAAVEYNVVGKTGKESNNYIGVKIGFFLGGGRQ